MGEHAIDPARVHHHWDNAIEPTLRIASGDVVHFDLAMAGAGQVERTSRFQDTRFDFATLYNLLGPIWVEGAQPGDTLQIEVLALEPGDWGWCAILPELGLLPDDFPEPYLKIFDLEGRARAQVAPGVSVPIEPFLGTMGVPPDEPGVHGPFPPRDDRALVVERSGLARADAYVLCSLAGDLKILDAGVWNVGFTLPLEVFEQ